MDSCRFDPGALFASTPEKEIATVMIDVSLLAARQNADGGWPYKNGISWTEPTVYALLALAARGESSRSITERAIGYLQANRRPDGGWAPARNIAESTWVTALALLLSSDLQSELGAGSAVPWLLRETGIESSWAQRMRVFLSNGHLPGREIAGWPWFQGTAAWVTPTALGILALERVQESSAGSNIRERCELARRFLVARRCRDGGWNHGSSQALGYDSDSYPETTGLALLALHGRGSQELEASLAKAEEHLSHCKSLEAASWLVLGLAAHGRAVNVDLQTLDGHPTVPGMALAVLAQQAMHGRNAFLN
jgi:hypothetical protein